MKRVLTGINTTGTLHIGNYVGAIRPAIRASHDPDVESFFFLADLHALIKCQDPERVSRSRKQIAATWLACGLDPEKVTFYRQSDLPQIPTLAWLLACSTSKGQMNRAHAYKAVLEANQGRQEDPDAGVSMGLFCYPILMAADILMFNADYVPVGRDQLQHLEMARDAATRFNNTYGREFFHMPQAVSDTEHDVLPGLDGRKMSKSYNNVIPLFEGGEKALRAAISQIKTDSLLPGEPKDPSSSSVTPLYEAFSTPEEAKAFKDALVRGMSWADAKEALFKKINGEIGPMRERYDALIAEPAKLEEILQMGAAKARALAAPFLAELTRATGLAPFTEGAASPVKEKEKKAVPVIKQYREKDGRFYFKLVDENGRLLIQSHGFVSGKEAGLVIQSLKKHGFGSIMEQIDLAEGVTPPEISAALEAIEAALEAKKEARSKI